MVRRWIVALGGALALSTAMADVRTPPQEGSIKTATIDMGTGCRIRLNVPSVARVSGGSHGRGSGSVTIENPLHLSQKTYVEPLRLRFICYDPDDEVVTDGWGKRLPNGQWVASVPPADEPLFKGALHTHQVQAVNASGWAVGVDDVIGDERYRTRTLYYCIIHTSKAVCGDSKMGLLPDIRRNPKHDLTPYALKILRSIEFIDEAATPSPVASQPATR